MLSCNHYNRLQFQHLYLLGRSATPNSVMKLLHSIVVTFQHLYLLGRSATRSGLVYSREGLGSFNTFTFWEGLRRARLRTPVGACSLVSTPLPSGKVCDGPPKWVRRSQILGFNTFTFWEGLRPLVSRGVSSVPRRDVSTPLPSGKVCDEQGYDERRSNYEFQHLYLLGRSATSVILIRSA